MVDKIKLEWTNILFFTAYHSLLIVGLVAYFYYRGVPSKEIIFWSLSLITLAGIGITAGYHRLFSHKSYEAPPIIRFILVIMGTLSIQGSVLQWAHDHRIHHAYTDTNRDPYPIKKGFLYAHILWIFKGIPKRDFSKIPDLSKDKLLVFQHKYIVPFFLSLNLGITILLGYFLKDYFGALVFTLLLRMFLVHHATFSINSFAHLLGKRPYNRKISAVDNFFVSIFTFGEGYHNYHHAFPHDYRNGVKGYNIDPGKWLIWSLSKVGLAKNLRRKENSSVSKI